MKLPRRAAPYGRFVRRNDAHPGEARWLQTHGSDPQVSGLNGWAGQHSAGPSSLLRHRSCQKVAHLPPHWFLALSLSYPGSSMFICSRSGIGRIATRGITADSGEPYSSSKPPGGSRLSTGSATSFPTGANEGAMPGATTPEPLPQGSRCLLAPSFARSSRSTPP